MNWPEYQKILPSYLVQKSSTILKVAEIEGLTLLQRILIVENAVSVELVFKPLSIVCRLSFLIIECTFTMHLIIKKSAQIVRTFRIAQFPISCLHSIHYHYPQIPYQSSS